MSATPGIAETTAPAQSANKPQSANRPRGAVLRSILPTLILSVALPIVTLNVLKNNGASDLSAYLWASVGPLIETIGSAIVRKKADRVSLLILTLTLGSAAISVIGNTSSTFLLLKDSAVTGVFGLVCLASIFIGRRPVMFYFAQKFTGSPEAAAQFDALWPARPGFRRGFRVMTLVWGVGYLLEAAVKVVIAETMSFETAFSLNQVLPLFAAMILGTFTVVYAKRMRRAGMRADARTLGLEHQ